MKLQLEDTGDPRLPVFAQTNEIDNVRYVGVPNLMNSVLKENQAMKMGVTSTSYIGKYFSTAPLYLKPLLSYAEVCFLRAEAAFRGWTTESAQTWYENGVRSSMEHYGISEADITSFIENGGAWANTVEQIMVQKWIAMFLDGCRHLVLISLKEPHPCKSQTGLFRTVHRDFLPG